MTTITLPPDIEATVRQLANANGKTPETIVFEGLRAQFNAPKEAEKSAEPNLEARSLYDFLQGYAGVVEGSGEPCSIDCGEKFTDGLIQKQQKKQL